jgi:hypothetical protein
VSIAVGALSSAAGHTAAHFERDVIVQRAGVRFLFRYPELGKHVDDDTRLHLQLAGQLIDANFAHTVTPRR